MNALTSPMPKGDFLKYLFKHASCTGMQVGVVIKTVSMEATASFQGLQYTLRVLYSPNVCNQITVSAHVGFHTFDHHDFEITPEIRTKLNNLISEGELLCDKNKSTKR